ncbi:hypothetical protein M5689_023924 [Euphorbia peplus]|nr:hypothetical protein M5689_023924 [Euphorbia peplus]
MFTSNEKVVLMVILMLSISAMKNGVEGARFLKLEIKEHHHHQDQDQEVKNSSFDSQQNGFTTEDAVTDRGVPDGPNPIHNDHNT